MTNYYASIVENNKCQLVLLLYALHFLIENNECRLVRTLCDQNCHNTAGSYTCSCNTGYTLDSDGFTCDGTYIHSTRDDAIIFIRNINFVDVNECNSDADNACQQICTDIPGSYTCQCNSGYRLNADERTCTGTR